MTTRTSMLFSVAISLVVASVLAIPGLAFAQEDDPEADEEVVAEQPDGPAPPLRRDVYDAGSWSLGIDGVFSRTSTRADFADQAGEARDTTRFLRLDSRLTVGVADRVHVGLLAGFVSRRLNHAGADASTDNAAAFQPMIQYIGSITRRFGLYGELGLGMYFGSSDRTIPEQDDEETLQDVQTRTTGFITTIGTGVNYRLSEGLQLRFGLSFNGLWGRESAEEFDESLSSSTTNLGTSAGFRYTF